MNRKITSRNIAEFIGVEAEYDALLLEANLQAAYEVVMGDILEDPIKIISDENKCKND